MLSPEQERERALKVSQLYGQKLIKPTALNSKPLNLSPAAFSGFVMAIPPVAFVTLLNIYQNTNYWNLSDVQGASMIFIPSLMAVFVITVVATKYAYQKLNNTYGISDSAFWIGLGLVAGFSLTFFKLTTGSGMQSPLEIITRTAIFAVGIGLVSLVAFITIVRIFYKSQK